MDDRTDLGARIRQLRGGGKLMSQRELADRAGVSIDLIQKLEQGRRHTASVGSLQRIARALDVTVAALLGKPAAVPSPDPAAGVVAIRRALTPVDDLIDDVVETTPLTLDEAERTVTYLWGCYWSGRYETLAGLLPSALMQLRATVRAVPTADRPRAAHILARGYQAAGDTLIHLGQQDTAWLAVREAMRAAQNTDDQLLAAALRVSVAWQLLIQGRYDESERVALSAAAAIEPGRDVSESQLAAYGILTMTGATAAARSQRAAATTELLAVAGDTAARLGYDRADHSTTFGPAKVAMQSVDCAVVQDNFGSALTAARSLPRDAALPVVSRARHLADVALAHMRLGHHDRALSTLLAMEDLAPADWLRHQAMPRQVVRELVEHQRRVGRPLRDLAIRIGALPR